MSHTELPAEEAVRLRRIEALAAKLFAVNHEPERQTGMLDIGCAFCRADWSGVGPDEPPHEPECPWVAMESLLGLGPNKRMEKWRIAHGVWVRENQIRRR